MLWLLRGSGDSCSCYSSGCSLAMHWDWRSWFLCWNLELLLLDTA